MLNRLAKMRARVRHGSDDADLRIGPANAFDASAFPKSRAFAVGGDEQAASIVLPVPSVTTTSKASVAKSVTESGANSAMALVLATAAARTRRRSPCSTIGAGRHRP